MKNRIFLLLSLVFVALGLSAQSLVFHLPDGGLSTVGLPATFTVSPSGDKLIIESGDTRVELDKNRILAMTYRSKKGDVNDDMQVDVADIATIIDIMAGKGGDTEPEEKVCTSCPDGNHPHIIDLGLPSGTKWACCNVGASKPEEYGDYFAWGETEPKEVYNWETYIHCDGSQVTCHDLGPDIAGTEYDAATANWKAPWRMPAKEQFQELIDNCTSEWTAQNDVKGRKFTGTNGGTIFLPATGNRWASELYGVGSYGYYWPSTPYDESYAYYLYFYSGDAYWYYCIDRAGGQSVRPVR